MDFFVLIAIVALAAPVTAVIAFVVALSQRERVSLLERRLDAAETELRRLRALPFRRQGAAEEAPRAEPTEAPDADRETTSIPEPPVTEPPPFPEQPPLPEQRPFPEPLPFPDAPSAAPAPPFTAPRPGFEERLGARWAVWVGGLALALGGVFLVRYSIEQGLLGPEARTAAGALFAALLLVAGEVMRRRDATATLPGIDGAQVPGVLTGAGVTSAFATAYAAHALYGLVGPALAFGLLGLIAVVAMLAAALHGPALAALGLVGALVSPVLVESDAPQVWPVVLYLGFVALAAYGVARLRLWAWLARAAAAGGVIWGVLLIGTETGPVMAHVAIQAALAALFLLVDAYRGVEDAESRPDGLAAGAVLAFVLVALAILAFDPVGTTARVIFAGGLVAGLVAVALRVPAGAPAAAWAALTAAGTLAVWPIGREVAAEAETVLPQVLGPDPQPEAVTAYLAFGLLASLGVAASSLWRVARGRDLPLATAAWLAGAATLGPLAALTIAWARVPALEISLPFALAGGLLGLGFAATAAALRRIEGPALDGVALAVGAVASAAVAALALGLTFALDRGMLTVAFALAALGTAWIADRTGIRALRWVVGAIGILVLGRLAWDPTVAGPDLGRTPIVNWLLWGYGVPAVAFALAGRILDRGGRDAVARLAEGLSLVFAALLVFFQIRHAVTGGDMLRPSVGHLEVGLVVTASLAFGMLMARVEAVRPDPVSRVAGLAFGAISLLLAAIGLGVVVNPLFRSAPVLGGPIVNSLVAAYLLPALLALALAALARGTRPRWYVDGAQVLSLGLLVLYAGLAVRRLFQGPSIDLFRPTSQGELWAHSLSLLAVGAGLLAVGLWRDWRGARLASGVVIAAAVVKVFVVDLATLEGAMRAFSFIGLGLALVGIGLAYQRLLARPIVGGATQ